MTREERIAARLIAALHPLIPAWCTVSIDADGVHMTIHGRWEVSVGLDPDERLADREAQVALNVLDALQDAIVRTSTDPWPPATQPTYLPEPGAVVREGQLIAWYGSEMHPTVALPPIDLSTI